MAAQILRQPTAMGDLLASLGSGLGTGLGSGLQSLANMKLAQMQKRQQSAQQSAQLQEAGVPHGLANFIATAPPKAQADLYSRLQGLGGAQQSIGGEQTPNGIVEGLDNIGTGAEAGQPGMGQATQPGAPQVTLGGDPAERRHQEDQTLKQSLANQAQSAPYLNKLAGAVASEKLVKHSAEKARDILLNNKDLFPTNIALRNLPTETRSNPKVRTYERYLKSIVSDMSEAIKGRPTEARIKLIEDAKASLSQPIGTQLEALEDIIERFSTAEDELQVANKIKIENGGKWPADIAFQAALRIKENEEKEGIGGQINAFFKNRDDKESHEDEIKNAYAELPSLKETEMGDEGHNRGYKFKRGKNRWLFRGIA